MFKSILTAFVFCVGANAFATTYNISIGQSADLQAGDVALIRDTNNAISAVTCAGGGSPPVKPARQQFEVERDARFSANIQTAGNDALRNLECTSYSADQPVAQAIPDALNAAREACFDAGYGNCAQPVVTDEQYSFYVRGNAPGNYYCEVIARIVGTQPN